MNEYDNEMWAEYNALTGYLEEAYGPSARDCAQMAQDDLEADVAEWAASPEGQAELAAPVDEPVAAVNDDEVPF